MREGVRPAGLGTCPAGRPPSRVGGTTRSVSWPHGTQSGGDPLPAALERARAADAEEPAASGLRGRGGAGFPVAAEATSTSSTR